MPLTSARSGSDGLRGAEAPGRLQRVVAHVDRDHGSRPAALATIRQQAPIPPVPMITTSSPTPSCDIWMRPFQAPLTGSVWHAASKLRPVGLQ